ncbi:MAG TPA: UvrB/UvrC motif-containing protein [Acidobacteriaceae bacterium]
MAAAFTFEHSLGFAPERAGEILRGIPALPGVFALRGSPPGAGEPEPQPYLTRAANLQRRMARLLARTDAVDAEGRPLLSKRLNLSARVASIDYTVTGSEFESLLVLYRASSAIFGVEEARRRLRLHTPYFLRFAAENAFPRLYTTNRLAKRSLAHTYGPFPSRAAADRYCEAVEDLFLIRRCHEELHPTPDHPGCIYGEMGKCLAPCNRAQVPANAQAYAAEAAAVEAFLNTHGESQLAKLTAEREQASADLNFERAAEVHTQIQKAKAAITLADDLVAPIPQLRAIIVQKATQQIVPPTDSLSFRSNDEVVAKESASPVPSEPIAGIPRLDSEMWENAPAAALFLLQAGCIFGPAHVSTLGVRAVREQTAVGSSLFAQPLMLSAVPLEEPATKDAVILSERALATESKDPENADGDSTARTVLTGDTGTSVVLNPETRASSAIASLETRATEPRAIDLATLSDHLSLLRRWYYRPEKQRAGEIFFPKAEGSFLKAEGSSPRSTGAWPVRRILRAAARAALGEPALLPEVRRDLAQKNPADTLSGKPPT